MNEQDKELEIMQEKINELQDDIKNLKEELESKQERIDELVDVLKDTQYSINRIL